MEIYFTPDAAEIHDALEERDARAYDRLWDVIESIENLGEDAKYVPWVQYVSSYDLWGTKVPGTDYTLFWRISGDTLYIASVLRDLGI